MHKSSACSRKHGSKPTHRCSSINSREIWRQRNRIPPPVLNSRGHQGPLHIAMPIPWCTIKLDCFTYGLVLRGSYVNTVTITEAVQALPLLLILLDHPPGCQQHPVIVRTTGTSAEDLLWLRVGMREDELLFETCFTYSQTKFSLATHKGKALCLTTSAWQGPLLLDKIRSFFSLF